MLTGIEGEGVTVAFIDSNGDAVTVAVADMVGDRDMGVLAIAVAIADVVRDAMFGYHSVKKKILWRYFSAL